MKNRIAIRNEHQLPARSRWFTRRSQAAGVLLSGWFFFWIVGIVQPCCVVFAGAHDDDQAISQTLSAEGNAHLAGAGGSTSHQNDECPLAFTADAPLPSQGSMLPATIDYIAHIVVGSHFAPLLAVSGFPNPLDVYHSSSPPRIFLRTQRLRI